MLPTESSDTDIRKANSKHVRNLNNHKWEPGLMSCSKQFPTVQYQRTDCRIQRHSNAETCQIFINDEKSPRRHERFLSSVNETVNNFKTHEADRMHLRWPLI